MSKPKPAEANQSKPLTDFPVAKRLLSSSEVMKHLHLEHKYVARLLKVLNEQIESIDAGEKPDLSVMHDAIGYMHSHVDRFHHAKEDIVYRKLAEQGETQKEEVLSLLIDHETINKKSEALLHYIEELQQEWTADLQRTLRLRCEDYVASMKRHMDYEESQVFPLVLSTLSEEDWSDIIHDIQPEADPLFGNTIEQRYANLFSAISESVERAAEEATVAQWVGLGAAMENIGVFSQCGSAIAKTINSHVKQAYKSNMVACRKLWQSGTKNPADYLSVSADCLLNNYDTCVDTLQDIGKILRGTRIQVAEPYTTRLRIYHESSNAPE